ncbi:hypothetical protein RUM43_001155 [Polyplax serrata]|uniref:SOCS box domain-containing protein n=1 Tax=Polyplax serrata TaxID=468196 RepID=A0AAN8SEF3_POLSC
MHLHFERNTNAKCDCAILSLTWMGKVPDELPEDEGWKLNRTNYYQEGWLATGHVRGIVGVTFTTSHCKKSVEYPLRTNYNLRGHRSEVILVKWNEPYQKLASCDSSGIIFVWIKYEGRWSIELINDRNTPVTHFAWSHDGRMALICYQDGFVLVGSVAGQRYWSSMLSLDSTITCGIWTPDDLQVYFGTSQGGLVVMDVHGAMVAQVTLAQVPVTSMAWSCEKFKMEEGDDSENADTRNLVLAVSLSTGYIYLMKSYDDVSPIQFNTGLGGPLCMEWSNSRQLLAVAGVANHTDTDYVNMLKCYTDTGELLYSTLIPYSQSPVTALTWGHNDKRLFVATGGIVHIAWVSRRVASLQLLSRLTVATALTFGESSVQSLPLPPRIKHLIGNLFAQTIRCCVPEMKGLREFVSRAPVNGTRLHCTMIRHDDEHLSSGVCYTLYLEYLGGLVPLLKGKRTSKIRPEFVIFDPQADVEQKDASYTNVKVTARGSDTSDTEKEDGCSGSPRAQRKKRKRRRSPTDHDDDLTYVDTLPEHARLVEVTSNIWGTKFKIHGLAECVPANLGQVTYKTSLLHLQPRQMSLVMTELSDDVQHTTDPSFNPKVFSEDEEEEKNSAAEKNYAQLPSAGPSGGAIPIAPMTPRREENRSRLLNSILNITDGNGSNFFRSPRFVYTNPSFLRERAELRKALINNNYSAPCTSTDSQVENVAQQSNGPSSSKTSQCSTIDFEKLIGDKSTPPTSTKSQPSVISSDKNTFNTYQNDKSTVESASKDISAVDKTGGKESVDLNLSDVISFCESFKIADIDGKKSSCAKIRQEKTETSFLNNQTSMKVVENRTLPTQSVDNSDIEIHPTTSSSTSERNQKQHSIRKRLEETLPQKNIGQANSKCVDDEVSNIIDRMNRSCSVGYLDDVDSGLVPCELTLKLLHRDSNKRLVLVGGSKKDFSSSQPVKSKSALKVSGKSRSFDSGELLLNKTDHEHKHKKYVGEKKSALPNAAAEYRISSTIKNLPVNSGNTEKTASLRESSVVSLMENIIEPLPPVSPRLPRSQPVTPAMTKKKRNQSSSPIRKHILNSPLLRRRRAKSKAESSDDDNGFSGDEAFTSSSHFKDLETFQKAQLRQKLKRGKVRDGNTTPKVRELVMHNKAPMWNENSQVYQLDFGGRVTQESAKNFQIEFKGKQVMQFGRIDGNAYTLDFQYPFSVLQAFSVALANVTQRLK